jgi:hypothetical protein
MSPGDWAVYIDPAGPPLKYGAPTRAKPEFQALMRSQEWDAEATAGLPQPMQFITEPGDQVYVPAGWVHSTWNLNDGYNVSYTKVRSIDVEPLAEA